MSPGTASPGPELARSAPGTPRATAGAIAQLARFREKPQTTYGWAKAWIGPAGGRMDFLGFTVIVPPGAVSKVTMFTIKLPLDPDGAEHVVAEFGPHNTTFAQPLTIGFPYRGTSIEGDASATVVWWNNAWVPMGGTVSADGSQFFTTTTHFSEFGTASYRGGGITASGG
ncbi:MAG TPA: hypothetical protein VM890_07560 [Longimicrobium sp.]|nr:hypothetical protein [Longimicrobium sp.]